MQCTICKVTWRQILWAIRQYTHQRNATKCILAVNHISLNNAMQIMHGTYTNLAACHDCYGDCHCAWFPVLVQWTAATGSGQHLDLTYLRSLCWMRGCYWMSRTALTATVLALLRFAAHLGMQPGLAHVHGVLLRPCAHKLLDQID